MLERLVAPLRFVIDLVVRFVEDDGLASAGYLAYLGIMSLLPFLIFLFALLGVVGQADQGAGIIEFMFRYLPSDVAMTLHDPVIGVVERSGGDVLTISILVVLWISASGVEGIRAALNRAYRTRETRHYWRRRLQSFGLVLLFSVFIAVAFACLIVGPILWQHASGFFDLGVEIGFGGFPDVLRFGLGGFSLFVVVCVLYHTLPNRQPSWIGVLPGAGAVCGLVMLSTSIFSVYLERFAQYSAIYGSLGGVISTMIFFYALGAVFVMGAELNALLAERSGGERPEETA